MRELDTVIVLGIWDRRQIRFSDSDSQESLTQVMPPPGHDWGLYALSTSKLSIFIIAHILCQSEAFVWSKWCRPPNMFCHRNVEVAADLPRLINLASKIMTKNDTVSSLTSLITFGDSWWTNSSSNPSLWAVQQNDTMDWQRVSGCLSDVRVRTHIADSHSEDGKTEDGHITVKGVADTRIARGLVALLVEVGTTGVNAVISCAASLPRCRQRAIYSCDAGWCFLCCVMLVRMPLAGPGWGGRAGGVAASTH